MDVQLVFRPALARLSLRSFHSNLKQIHRLLRQKTALHSKNCQMMAVVKANAYGHQNERIVPELLRFGVRHFAVASLEEGIALRRLAKREQILVLGGSFEWNRGSLGLVRKLKLSVAINDLKSLRFFLDAPDIPLHLKLDTGMNRLGLRSEDWGEALQLLKSYRRNLEGLFTHYACFRGPDFRKQILIFDEAARWFWSEGQRPQWIHSENSAALFSDEDFSKNSFLSEHANLARPGISMYGYLPRNFHLKTKLEPLLELSSEIGWVKKVLKGEGVSYDFDYRAKTNHEIGVVPIGYADGIAKDYRHSLKPVLVDSAGRIKAKLKICGVICMDLLMVKASPKIKLRTGDRVIFWGYSDCEFIKRRLADPYELNLRIAGRIPRVWVT